MRFDHIGKLAVPSVTRETLSNQGDAANSLRFEQMHPEKFLPVTTLLLDSNCSAVLSSHWLWL